MRFPSQGPRGTLAAAVLACVATLAMPAPAHAGADQVSVMMDDDELLYGTDRQRQRALRQMKRAGVDVVRVSLLWKVLAPRRKHKRFNPRDPSTYHSGIWNRYDRLVREAYEIGIFPLFNVTWPGPAWAHSRTDNPRLRRLGTYRPKRREWARFVRALAQRYNGTYVDENEGKQVLPRVVLWSFGNEPNHGGWLTPQWTARGKGRARRWVPTSPHVYRELYTSAAFHLRKAGHGPDTTVLVGELAPVGRRDKGSTRPISPGRFLREMLCLDSKYRPLRGASARIRRCDRAAPLDATAFAYHPYSPDHSPRYRPGDRDAFTMGNISELPPVLDRAAQASGLLPAGLQVWLSEYGYETDPPDRHHGVSLTKQSRYINEGEMLAYREPRVRAMTQFLLRDSAPRRRFRRNSKPYWLSYQSGVLYASGRPKPAWLAYLMPFVVESLPGGVAKLWGQVRLAGNHQAPYTVEIRYSEKRNGPWRALTAVRSDNPFAFYEAAIAPPASGYLQAGWRGADGRLVATSREARFARR